MRPIIGEFISFYGFLGRVSTNFNVLGMNQTRVFCLRNINKESTKSFFDIIVLAFVYISISCVPVSLKGDQRKKR